MPPIWRQQGRGGEGGEESLIFLKDPLTLSKTPPNDISLTRISLSLSLSRRCQWNPAREGLPACAVWDPPSRPPGGAAANIPCTRPDVGGKTAARWTIWAWWFCSAPSRCTASAPTTNWRPPGSPPSPPGDPYPPQPHPTNKQTNKQTNQTWISFCHPSIENRTVFDWNGFPLAAQMQAQMQAQMNESIQIKLSVTSFISWKLFPGGCGPIPGAPAIPPLVHDNNDDW